jgi:hypothetical protein
MTDLAYLAKRITLGGPYATETDLDEAAAIYLGDPQIGWLRRWLAQHAMCPRAWQIRLIWQ